MKDTLKKMFIMQLSYGGIPDDIFHFLPPNEQALLIEKNGRFYLTDKERLKIKVVMTGGVFDVLHIGHIMTLSEAAKHGDVLVVVVARDEMIKNKNRVPIHSQEYRKIMVEAIKPVDIALSGSEEPSDLVKFVGPDVIVYGYDQKEIIKPEGVSIVRLEKRIDDSKYKTGKIIEELGL